MYSEINRFLKPQLLLSLPKALLLMDVTAVAHRNALFPSVHPYGYAQNRSYSDLVKMGHVTSGFFTHDWKDAKNHNERGTMLHLKKQSAVFRTHYNGNCASSSHKNRIITTIAVLTGNISVLM